MENEQKRPDDGATVCETFEVGQTNAKAKKAKRKWTNNKNQWKAWLYLLPALILLLLKRKLLIVTPPLFLESYSK